MLRLLPSPKYRIYIMSHKTVNHLSSLLRNSVLHYPLSPTKQTHTQILLNNYLTNVTFQTDFLLADSKSGVLQDARKVFDRMYDKNMHSWNIMLFSYVLISLYSDVICVFGKLLKMGFGPDHYTLIQLFKFCKSGNFYLWWVLHNWVIRLGFEGNVVVGSTVLDFYVKYRELVDANRFFSEMLWMDSGVWNLRISGYGRAGFYAEAFSLFRNMIAEGVKVDGMTTPSILNVAGGGGDQMKGIHGQVVKSALFDGDVAVGNSLIYMYAKGESLGDSEKVFQNMQNLNVVTWTTMISSYEFIGKERNHWIFLGK